MIEKLVHQIRGRLAHGAALRSLRAGDVEGATEVCRAYLAARLPAARLPLTGFDARVAALAALCAALAGDADEVKGAAKLLKSPDDPAAIESAAAVAWCRAAVKGKLDAVLEGEAQPPARWSQVAPVLVLVTLERHIGKVTPEIAKAVRARLAGDYAAPALRARAAVVLATLALREGDRAEAMKQLSTLPAGAAPAYAAIAAIARQDVDGAVAAASALPPKERDTALTIAAAFAIGGDGELSRRVLDAVGGQVSAATRTALTTSLALARAREGDPRAALAVLEAEQPRGPTAPLLAAATAYINLLDGDAARARDAIRDAKRADPTTTMLTLAALALAGDHPALVDAVRSAKAIPDRHAPALRPLVLAALARGGAPPDALPPWLATPPEDALGLYAWALVRLQQGDGDEALAAFELALEMKPDLAALGDAPEVARLRAARARLLEGDAEEAATHAAAVKSPRLAATGARLAALALLQRRAGERKLTLRADNLPAFAAEIARDAKAGSIEARGLELIQSDLGLLRARNLLRAGKPAEARAVMDPLRAAGTPEVAFLAAAVDLCAAGVPLADVEAALGQAVEQAPDDPALQVLLAEVDGAARGPGARAARLAAARAKTQHPLLDHALTSAYQRAGRALDAKQIGFTVLRRSPDAPPELRAELERALSFEVPPPANPRAAPKPSRRPARDVLAAKGVTNRAHVLLAHAAAACERDPAVRSAVEPIVQKLKRSLMEDEVASALAAEREILSHLRRARP
ncbi:MAG: hypothetical protein QM820_16795 [Minicystis sp.]